MFGCGYDFLCVIFFFNYDLLHFKNIQFKNFGLLRFNLILELFFQILINQINNKKLFQNDNDDDSNNSNKLIYSNKLFSLNKLFFKIFKR